MAKVKKVLNIEYDLTSEEFKAQKQDEVSQKCQDKHSNFVCKVTTFCVPDKQIVVSTTEENRLMFGASDKMLAHRGLNEQSFLNMDDEMLKTFEITITADTDLPDYVTAIDIAQSKADEMFDKDDSKIPLVTVIDYRWGNVPATLSASIFGDTDENGDTVPLIGANDASSTVVGGNVENGKVSARLINNVNLPYTSEIGLNQYSRDDNFKMSITFKMIPTEDMCKIGDDYYATLLDNSMVDGDGSHKSDASGFHIYLVNDTITFAFESTTTWHTAIGATESLNVGEIYTAILETDNDNYTILLNGEVVKTGTSSIDFTSSIAPITVGGFNEEYVGEHYEEYKKEDFVGSIYYAEVSVNENIIFSEG